MTYTLTEKEVSALHNAKCYLIYALDHCDEMFKEDASFVKQMKMSMDYLKPVATRLMKELDEARERNAETASRIAKTNEFKNTVWSIYEVSNFEEQSGIPIGAKLYSYYSGKDITVTVEGPTWFDVWKATDKLIGMTREDHGDHIFIESYDKVKNQDNVYEVNLGS